MKQARKQERGFALLVVFLLAAMVAFALYQELPRAAFESARDKEQILIDRGNQYKRAIEVFYAVNKRYPAELKDLENTNDKRYLRRRYKDPMTGQDEWRIIHTNGSALTDSLVQKAPAQNAANGAPASGSVVGGGPLGNNTMNTTQDAPDAAGAIDPATGAPAQPQVNAAAQRRPSDRGFSAGGFPAPGPAQGVSPFGSAPNPPGFDPNDPRTWPPISLASPANVQTIPNGATPGQPPGTQILPGNVSSGIPGQTPGLGGANPQAPTFDPLNPAGSPLVNPLGNNQNGSQPVANPGSNSFNQLLNQPPPAQFPQNGPTQPPAGPQFPAPAPTFGPTPAGPAQSPSSPQQVGSGGANSATQFINNQLFSPTQTGPLPGAQTPSVAPGIAGVASKFKGPSIKSYKKRTKYQEWEFVFEPSTQTTAGVPGQVNGNALNPNQPNANQPGQQSGQQPGQQGGTTNPFTQMFGGSPGQGTGQTSGQPSAPAAPQTNP